MLERLLKWFKKKEEVAEVELKFQESPTEPGLNLYRRLRQLTRQRRRASQHYNRG